MIYPDFSETIYAGNLSRADFTPAPRPCVTLEQHWLDYGLDHGVAASTVTTREGFLALLPGAEKKGLEVGPFFNPALPTDSPNVFFADVLSTEELVARGVSIGADISRIPTISYLYKDGRLQTGGQHKFDYVFSSHCLEHQPDLIAHIKDVFANLANGGHYFFIVPDHRMCFDRYMNPSSLAEILAAHLERRTKPSLKSTLEHRMFTIDYSDPFFPDPYVQLVGHARNALEAAVIEYQSNDYVDVHCWYFTPKHLKNLFANLPRLGVLPEGTSAMVFPLGNEIGCVLTPG
jgi:SAM-dependent methyltransferase